MGGIISSMLAALGVSAPKARPPKALKLKRERCRVSRMELGKSNFSASLYIGPGMMRFYPNKGPQRTAKEPSRRDLHRASVRSHQARKGVAA